jgi:hypothetical protein
LERTNPRGVRERPDENSSPAPNHAHAEGQVVGMQWQFAGTNVDPDASASCPIDVNITDMKFLPP